MAKFNNKPQEIRDLVQYLTDDYSSRNEWNITTKMKEWEELYPNSEFILEFDEGCESCNMGCCGESPSIKIYASRLETPIEIEIRRIQWQNGNLKSLKRRSHASHK